MSDVLCNKSDLSERHRCDRKEGHGGWHQADLGSGIVAWGNPKVESSSKAGEWGATGEPIKVPRGNPHLPE